MNPIKASYVSLYATAATALLGYSGWQLWNAGSAQSPWLGALLAAAGPCLFFLRLFLMDVARTETRLWSVLAFGLVGTGISLLLGGGIAALLAAAIGIAGTLLYDHWYSSFGQRSTDVLAPGKTLPTFSLQDADGNTYSSDQLTQQPTVWMFYRGNWCPLCMAQIKEVAALYRELDARGAKVILISPQSESNTRALAERFDVPMQFLVDVGNQAARTLNIFAENGLPTGLQALGYDSDVPMPTVFITAQGGEILYADLTENYRIRPEPQEFLRVLDQASAV